MTLRTTVSYRDVTMQGVRIAYREAGDPFRTGSPAPA